MNKAVLDTTVIVKGALTPYKSLPEEIYSRELGTHQKCRLLLNILDESSVEVFIPKVCVIETAAVLKRLANRDLAAKLSRGLMRAYDLVGEPDIFESAWRVALDRGSTGFDTYFLALARMKDALLFTE
ncbi:PIN domain-containing protein [Methanothrix harundinacea]|uniref:Putative nucleic acid-binding protein n=1 Tax=Methanothrix harundinacea (strain 6Ac) TaxID=1110509 RepID=G7WQQ4_METH6|nr:PIN domain-containing protein [Methanothrix harundinacea]AET65688.1 putative nucleic acid-binding protein [Methanothrix harundinacea 6Ac]